MTDPIRMAGAPISWGVCEVPGWGYQLPADRVLAEMSDIGLAATELGPDGFLPGHPERLATVLADHHLTAAVAHTVRAAPRRCRTPRRAGPAAARGSPQPAPG